MEILANLLRELGCAGGLIPGDFNVISPEDHALLDKNGLVDAWVTLHGKERLDTWGVGWNDLMDWGLEGWTRLRCWA